MSLIAIFSIAAALALWGLFTLKIIERSNKARQAAGEARAALDGMNTRVAGLENRLYQVENGHVENRPTRMTEAKFDGDFRKTVNELNSFLNQYNKPELTLADSRVKINPIIHQPNSMEELQSEVKRLSRGLSEAHREIRDQQHRVDAAEQASYKNIVSETIDDLGGSMGEVGFK